MMVQKILCNNVLIITAFCTACVHVSTDLSGWCEWTLLPPIYFRY